MKIRLRILNILKLSFFLMFFYSSFLMEALDVRIANMTLLLGAVTTVFMLLDMQHSHIGLRTILTSDVKLLLAFTLFSALGVLFAYYPRSAVNGLIQLMQSILLMIITIYISIRDGSISFCARTLVIVMAVATVYAIVNAQSLDHRLALTAKSNANVFGHNAVIGAACASIAFDDSRRFMRRLVPALVVLFTLGVVFSASRMSFLALMGYFACYLFFYVPHNTNRSLFSGGSKFLFALIAMAVLIMALLPLFAELLISDRMTELLAVFNTGVGDGQTRLYLYRTAIEEFLQHPIFGLGYANFAPLHYGVYTHSTYAEVLSCTGIVGTFFFALYYLHIMKGIRYGIRLSDPMLQKTNRRLLLLFAALLLLGIGEILLYKIKFFIVYGIIAAQLWMNRRYGKESAVAETAVRSMT